VAIDVPMATVKAVAMAVVVAVAIAVAVASEVAGTVGGVGSTWSLLFFAATGGPCSNW